MSKASWAEIERDREKKRELPDDHIIKVMARIGDTPDGKMLRDWIHDSILMTSAKEGTPESALRDFEANRRIGHRFYKLLES